MVMAAGFPNRTGTELSNNGPAPLQDSPACFKEENYH